MKVSGKSENTEPRNRGTAQHQYVFMCIVPMVAPHQLITHKSTIACIIPNKSMGIDKGLPKNEVVLMRRKDELVYSKKISRYWCHLLADTAMYESKTLLA